MDLADTLHERRWRAVVSAALLAAWAASLPLLVAVVDHRDRIDEYHGWAILLLGILGTLIAQVGWWANPILLCTCTFLMFSRRTPGKRTLLALAVILLVCLASSLLWRSVMDDSGNYPIIRYGPGYALWLATVATCAAWLALLALTRKTPEPT